MPCEYTLQFFGAVWIHSAQEQLEREKNATPWLRNVKTVREQSWSEIFASTQYYYGLTDTPPRPLLPPVTSLNKWERVSVESSSCPWITLKSRDFFLVKTFHLSSFWTFSQNVSLMAALLRWPHNNRDGKRWQHYIKVSTQEQGSLFQTTNSDGGPGSFTTSLRKYHSHCSTRWVAWVPLERSSAITSILWCAYMVNNCSVSLSIIVHCIFIHTICPSPSTTKLKLAKVYLK